jgi:ABC-type amino acid transport substrate-binding protein
MMTRMVALLISLFVFAAGPAFADTLRIAHQADFKPFIFVENGKTAGEVPDILNAAAAREGITIVWVPVSLADLPAALTNGTADALAPFGTTPDRMKSYDFTTTFVVTGGALFVKSPGPVPDGLGALSGKTVVTPKTGPFVAFIRENFPKVKVVPTADYAESLDRVVSGQADAAALNIQVGTGVVAASYSGKITASSTMFTKAPLALAVTKGQHADLLKRLDAGLDAIRADGTLQQIQDRWESNQ